MTRTRHDRPRRGQLRNLHSCAWSITTAAVPSSSCSAAWCPRCYVQGRHGDTPERRTLMFRSTLKSSAAQYKPPVWNKRCATPSLSRTPSASGDGTSPTHPACGPWSNSSYSPTSIPSRRGRPSNSLGVISLVLRISEVRAMPRRTPLFTSFGRRITGRGVWLKSMSPGWLASCSPKPLQHIAAASRKTGTTSRSCC